MSAEIKLRKSDYTTITRLAKWGAPDHHIAAEIGVSPDTFRRLCDRDPKCALAVHRGRETELRLAWAKLNELALGGSLGALKLVLERHEAIGPKDTEEQQRPAGGVLVVPYRDATPEEWAERARRQQAILQGHLPMPMPGQDKVVEGMAPDAPKAETAEPPPPSADVVTLRAGCGWTNKIPPNLGTRVVNPRSGRTIDTRREK